MEKILAGNTNIRNPILATFVAKGLLPYHGLGSGIMRVRKLCPDVTFLDDKDGVQFKAILPRRDGPSGGSFGGSQKSSQKSSQKIMAMLTWSPGLTTQELADNLGVSRRAVAKHIAELQRLGCLRRVGPDKGGYWEVVSDRSQ